MMMALSVDEFEDVHDGREYARWWVGWKSRGTRGRETTNGGELKAPDESYVSNEREAKNGRGT